MIMIIPLQLSLQTRHFLDIDTNQQQVFIMERHHYGVAPNFEILLPASTNVG